MRRFIFLVVDYLLKMHQKEVYKSYKVKFEIDDSFRFNGKDIILAGKGQIIAKRNSYIGVGSSISTNQGFRVEIGENCAISHNVRIYNNSYLADCDFNIMPREQKYGNVCIGNGVWIGSNVVILPNVTIGDNTVIGANSVVVKDIPSNSIASGIPCKILREKKHVP